MTALPKRSNPMSKFCQREYFGCRFTPRPGPNDIVRRWNTIPFLHTPILPYFNGGDLQVRVNIRPVSASVTPRDVNYQWTIEAKDKNVNWNPPSGSGTIHLPNDSVILDLGHFPFSGQYILKMDVRDGEDVISQSLVDYGVLPRDEWLMRLWWIVLSVAAGFVIGRFT